MKQIRHSVFETNSSSTHSLSIVSRKLMPSDLSNTDWRDIIQASFGRYGWGPNILTSQEQRLSYLCTMFWETECRGRGITDVKDICNKPGFKLIQDVVLKSTGKRLSMEKIYMEGCELVIDGYIDHQSCEKYSDLADFLNSNGLTAEEFIFGNVTVNIDNDNH